MSLAKELAQVSENNRDDTHLDAYTEEVMKNIAFAAKNGKRRCIIGSLRTVSTEDRERLLKRLEADGFRVEGEMIMGNQYFKSHTRYVVRW